MIWFTLALFAISFLVVALLAPKPNIENARAQSLDDVNFPRATEDAPIPLVLGKVRLTAPNVTWFGDFQTVAIRKKVKTGLFSSKRITTGYNYYLTMDLALCMGPGVALREVHYDDKIAWQGNTGGAGPYAVTSSVSLGGKENGGDMSMSGFFYSGSFSLAEQPVDSVIESKVGAGNVPAYLGTSHISMSGLIGESAQLRKIAFILECYTNDLLLTGSGRIGEDMNPAEAIYQVLKDDWRGTGVSVGDIDIDSLKAIGETLYTEGNGVSLQVTAESNGKKIIEEILRQVDGVAYQDAVTGLIKFKLIRNDYDRNALPVFDEDDIIKISNFSRSGWEEVIAQVKITFPQRDKDSNAVAVSQDMATVGMIGRLSSATVSMPFCYDKALANTLASRERSQLSVPLFRMTLEMNRNGSTLKPGDVFKLNWPEYNIEELVLRVQEFDFGSLLDGKIVVNCLQDNFAIDTPVFAAPSDSGWTQPIIDPQPILITEVLEMPRFYMNRVAVPIPDLSAGAVPLGLKPSSQSTGFDFFGDEESGEPYFVDPEAVPYPATGTLIASYSRDAGFATGVDATGFSLTAVSQQLIGAITLADMRPGEVGIMYLNGEYIGFLNVTDNLDGSFSITNVYRGLFGTSPKSHPVGTRVWQLSPDLFSNLAVDENGTLYYKFADRIGPVLDSVEGIAESTKALTRWARRPQRVRYLQLIGSRTPTVNNSTGIASLTWTRSNREHSEVTVETDPDQVPDISDALSETYDIEVRVNDVVQPSLSVTDQPGPTSHSLDFTGTVLYGPGEIRVTSRWNYAGTDILSVDHAFLPVTFDQSTTILSYTADGSHIINDAVTTINVPYPTLSAGDLLILTVMCRSDLTIPAGWVQSGREDGPLNRIYILTRRADGTEAGNLTLTQAVSNRFIGQMASITGGIGVPFFYVDTQGGATGVDTMTGPVSTGSHTPDYNSTIGWYTYTNNLAEVSIASDLSIQTGQGATQISPTYILQNRLGIAYEENLSIGNNDPDVTWNNSLSGSSDINWIIGSVVDAFDVKLFGHPAFVNNGFATRFDQSITFEDVGATDTVEDGDLIYVSRDLVQSNNPTALTTGDRPTWIASGRLARFTGSDAMRANINPNSAQGSLYLRFRADLGVGSYQISLGSSNVSYRCYIALYDGIAAAGIGNLSPASYRDPAATDLRSATDFHTMVMTWNGTNTALYVDGAQVYTGTWSGSIPPVPPTIGARNNSGNEDFFFQGDVFSAGMIDREITTDEIIKLHDYFVLAQTS